MDFYSTRQWRTLRYRWRRAHPDCVRCGGPAQHVDHVIDIRTAPERKLDPFNLQSLCVRCHNEKTAADKAGRPVRPHGGCDVSGMPTDPNHPWGRGAVAIRPADRPRSGAAVAFQRKVRSKEQKLTLWAENR